jgi:pyruvate/2-oxoglutarate dehydrogenase complex dihydrolipoamide acyltransferase (E2) component
MHSTPNPKQTDPRDFLMIAPEDKELSNLAHDAMCYSSAQTRMGSDFSAGSPIPPVDLRFRPAAVNNVEVPGDRPSIGRRAVRAFIRFLWVACIGGAGVAWQFYGDAAKQIIAKWAPQFVLILSPPLENPRLPEQPTPPAVQASATKAAPPQPAPLAQTSTEGAAALSPESAQLLQSMARDLATAGQEIEQLKASQEQMFRDVAKASEQNRRPKISASPRRSAAAPPRKPMPFRPSQAAAAPTLPQAAAPSVLRQPEPQPQATAQPQVEPELSSVPRPPMPVH